MTTTLPEQNRHLFFVLAKIFKAAGKHAWGSFINYVDSSGGGVSQMTILLHKPYLVKVSTKGAGRGKNTQNFDHMVYG